MSAPGRRPNLSRGCPLQARMGPQWGRRCNPSRRPAPTFWRSRKEPSWSATTASSVCWVRAASVITYLAEEIALARLITIKEYFPSDFAARAGGQSVVPRDPADASTDFQWGLDRFIDEAQTLARFDHPNIVRVYRYFKANGTAYMVLSFEEGQSLKAWLKGLGRAPRQREIDEVLRPLLDALEVIHGTDFLHRDIAPDNVIIRRDGSPVLIDFGSARGDIAKHSRTVSALVKPGYSPYEQYATTASVQGPWTDIYALGATLYHAIAGKRPPDSPPRRSQMSTLPRARRR